MRRCELLLLVVWYNAHPVFPHVLGPPLLVREYPTQNYLLVSMLQQQVHFLSLEPVFSLATLVGLTGLLPITASLDGFL
uniref:Uncharacterized protein n=1 Tax=Beet black scorch virus TaxID=196375 RepID=D1GV45_9TOMB|nr:9K hypothetical protein, p9 [Beet black scorch virus]